MLPVTVKWSFIVTVPAPDVLLNEATVPLKSDVGKLMSEALLKTTFP
jgi:hypothetical protein